jgi:hypothetical protein
MINGNMQRTSYSDNNKAAPLSSLHTLSEISPFITSHKQIRRSIQGKSIDSQIKEVQQSDNNRWVKEYVDLLSPAVERLDEHHQHQQDEDQRNHFDGKPQNTSSLILSISWEEGNNLEDSTVEKDISKSIERTRQSSLEDSVNSIVTQDTLLNNGMLMSTSQDPFSDNQLRRAINKNQITNNNKSEGRNVTLSSSNIMKSNSPALLQAMTSPVLPTTMTMSEMKKFSHFTVPVAENTPETSDVTQSTLLNTGMVMSTTNSLTNSQHYQNNINNNSITTQATLLNNAMIMSTESTSNYCQNNDPLRSISMISSANDHFFQHLRRSQGSVTISTSLNAILPSQSEHYNQPPPSLRPITPNNYDHDHSYNNDNDDDNNNNNEENKENCSPTKELIPVRSPFTGSSPRIPLQPIQHIVPHLEVFFGDENGHSHQTHHHNQRDDDDDDDDEDEENGDENEEDMDEDMNNANIESDEAILNDTNDSNFNNSNNNEEDDVLIPMNSTDLEDEDFPQEFQQNHRLHQQHQHQHHTGSNVSNIHADMMENADEVLQSDHFDEQLTNETISSEQSHHQHQHLPPSRPMMDNRDIMKHSNIIHDDSLGHLHNNNNNNNNNLSDQTPDSKDTISSTLPPINSILNSSVEIMQHSLSNTVTPLRNPVHHHHIISGKKVAAMSFTEFESKKEERRGKNNDNDNDNDNDSSNDYSIVDDEMPLQPQTLTVKPVLPSSFPMRSLDHMNFPMPSSIAMKSEIHQYQSELAGIEILFIVFLCFLIILLIYLFDMI